MSLSGGAPAPWTVRVATWSARHAPIVFVLWFVATVGLFGLSLAAGGINTLDIDESPDGPPRESREAGAVFGAGAPVDPSERIVAVIDGGPDAVDDPAFRERIASLIADPGAARAESLPLGRRRFSRSSPRMCP